VKVGEVREGQRQWEIGVEKKWDKHPPSKNLKPARRGVERERAGTKRKWQALARRGFE